MLLPSSIQSGGAVVIGAGPTISQRSRVSLLLPGATHTAVQERKQPDFLGVHSSLLLQATLAGLKLVIPEGCHVDSLFENADAERAVT